MKEPWTLARESSSSRHCSKWSELQLIGRPKLIPKVSQLWGKHLRMSSDRKQHSLDGRILAYLRGARDLWWITARKRLKWISRAHQPCKSSLIKSKSRIATIKSSRLLTGCTLSIKYNQRVKLAKLKKQKLDQRCHYKVWQLGWARLNNLTNFWRLCSLGLLLKVQRRQTMCR